MKKILMLCPSKTDLYMAKKLSLDTEYEIYQHSYAADELRQLTQSSSFQADIAPITDEIQTLCKRYGNKIDAIISTSDYPGSSLASIVAHHINLPAVNPHANLLCQHKYLFRCTTSDAFPENTPSFRPFDPANPSITSTLPVYLKPVKSSLSIGTQKITKQTDLQHLSFFPDAYFSPLQSLLACYTDHKESFYKPCYFIEEAIDGHLVTVEGYAHHNTIHTIGIVDSFRFPGTIGFKQFVYPSYLSASVQDRMHDLVKNLMRYIDFNQGQFNVELIYNEQHDRIYIVEVNTRLSHQFSDLFEKVDGKNSYHDTFDLACDMEPTWKLNSGKHATAASFILSHPHDYIVEHVPTPEEIETIEERYPDIRVNIYAQTGKQISQTRRSEGIRYVYAMINIGGNSLQECEDILEDCKQTLSFRFR
jgi:hypothetical protein